MIASPQIAIAARNFYGPSFSSLFKDDTNLCNSPINVQVKPLLTSLKIYRLGQLNHNIFAWLLKLFSRYKVNTMGVKVFQHNDEFMIKGLFNLHCVLH